MGAWVSGWVMDKQVDEWIGDGWMGMGGWMDRQTDGWING